MTENLSDKEQLIFHFLEDSLSRQVFLGRKFAAEHSDTSLLANCVSGLDKSELINAIGEKQYYCYGNGTGKGNLCGLSYFVSLIKGTSIEKNCLGVFDRNIDLHGRKSEFWDVNIMPVPKYNPETIIVITVLRKEFISEIRNYLKQIGVSDSNIIIFAEYLKVSQEQYFDKFITDRLSENEIFLDCGSYDFSTSLEFIKHAKSVKKIYAFEPDGVMFNAVNQNYNNACLPFKCEMIKAGAYSHNGNITFESFDISGNSRIIENMNNVFNKSSNGKITNIDVVRIDDVVTQNEKVTFIKMDIEGSELEALKGAVQVISKNKPILAVCIYHKQTDYIDIPIFIMQLVPEYKMYMRHYSVENAETVLYCVL